MVEREKFQWAHPMSVKLINDGPTILLIILRKFRPNKLITAFNEIKRVKEILPSKFEHNITDWDTAIEEARIDVETKLPNEYSETAFINDYFTACLTVPVKSFASEVNSMKHKWQLGMHMDMEYVRTTICQLYINLEEDKIWARELAEVSQIIALTTKIDSLESKLQSTIALATSTNNAGGG